jgi:pyruvate kinase
MVMVARGDLGVETSASQVPMAKIESYHGQRHAKIVITAPNARVDDP